MKLLRVTFSLRDLWVGAYWLTYRRDTYEHNGTPLATDIWVCPIPFVKFHFRIEHTKLLPAERRWMDQIQYEGTTGQVNDNDADSKL